MYLLGRNTELGGNAMWKENLLKVEFVTLAGSRPVDASLVDVAGLCSDGPWLRKW